MCGDFDKPVDSYLPNELGIYDMSGHVREWVLDWYGSYNDAYQVHPTGPTEKCHQVRSFHLTALLLCGSGWMPVKPILPENCFLNGNSISFD